MYNNQTQIIQIDWRKMVYNRVRWVMYNSKKSLLSFYPQTDQTFKPEMWLVNIYKTLSLPLCAFFLYIYIFKSIHIYYFLSRLKINWIKIYTLLKYYVHYWSYKINIRHSISNSEQLLFSLYISRKRNFSLHFVIHVLILNLVIH